MFSYIKRAHKIFKILFWGFVVVAVSFFSKDEGKSLGGLGLFKSSPPKAYADTPPPPGDGGWGDGSGDQDSGGSGNSSGGDGGGGGCSLLVEYWNGVSYMPLDVYSPRYYQPVLNAVSIPKGAIQKSGKVRMRVTATKRHKIYFAGFMAPERYIPLREERFGLSRAYNKREEKDYAGILNKPRSGEYLRTIPGDTVDVVFRASKPRFKKSEQEAYLLRAGGVYTAASEEAQIEAGDWVNRLDPEGRAFLKKMYSLNTYQNKNKKTGWS